MKNKQPMYVTGICGQEYWQNLPYDLPRKVSIVSTENVLLLVYTSHRGYTNVNISVVFTVSECYGLYASDPSIFHYVNDGSRIKKYEILFDEQRCVQLHSLLSLTDFFQRYLVHWDQVKTLLFRCKHSNCNFSYRIEILHRSYYFQQSNVNINYKNGVHISKKSKAFIKWTYELYIGSSFKLSHFLKHDQAGLHIMLIHSESCVLPCTAINNFTNFLKPITSINECNVCQAVFLYDQYQYILR